MGDNRTVENRTIALAGLYQAIGQVSSIAWSGRIDEAAFDPCIRSLFQFDASSYAEVYGGLAGIRPGLRALDAALARQEGQEAIEQARYAVTILFLERKLARRSKNLEALRAGIEGAAATLEYFGPTHANTIARLAEIYRETISSLGPRIMVKGDQDILANPDNASRIRAMLLCAIRAAVLWRQAGGSRWRLLLERGAMRRSAGALLSPETG